MPLTLGDLEASVRERLNAHARALLERSAQEALTIHADEVGPEHLLCALMADEDGAARRVVEHAFADPETVFEEARALAAGILVSGSVVTLPFSTLGVAALEEARRRAWARGDEAVLGVHLLLAGMDALPNEDRAALDDAGYDPAGLERTLGAAPAPRELPDRIEGSLFRRFDEPAKRLLSKAARGASRAGAPSIGPAHMVLTILESERALATAAAVSHSRARMVLHERTVDATPAPDREVEPDEALGAYLEGLPPGTTSLELLERFHAGGTPELAGILGRHKVTPALLERSRGAFRDPGDG